MRVTIITVTKNSSNTIGKCITSINEQSYDDIEHIFIDSESTDSTINIIKKNAKRNIRLISEPDDGIYDAMNKGIRIASGDIIGILNSDDKFISKDSISKIVDVFINHKVSCTYGNMIYTNKKGKITRIWKSKEFKPGLFKKSWTPGHPTFYCKKELYEKYGLYKTDYQIASDVELMLRFLEIKKVQSYYINDYLVEMLEGGKSNEGFKSTIVITNEIRRAFNENNLRLPIIKYLFYKALKIREFI